MRRARAPWSRRCILESSPQQGRALPPCGHSPTTREAETAASPRACCVSWVVYGIGHAITLRRGTPNEVAEATCSTGRLCGHRGLGQGLRRHRPQGQAWGLKSELGRDESHQAALTSVLPSFLTLRSWLWLQRPENSTQWLQQHEMWYIYHLTPPWFFPEPSTKVASC